MGPPEIQVQPETRDLLEIQDPLETQDPLEIQVQLEIQGQLEIQVKADKLKDDAIIMHPLPRNSELCESVDSSIGP